MIIIEPSFLINSSPLVKTYTLEEFFDLPEPTDHSKLELINGVLYMSPMPDWRHATLVEIIEKPASIEINLSIPLDSSNKSAQKSIILSSMLQISKNKMIQGLKVRDQVKISGNFIEKEGFIDIDNYSDYKFSKNVFDNPEFKIELLSIEY